MDKICYDIVRHYNNGVRLVLHRDVPLEVAKAHVRAPETKQDGIWFDGYEQRIAKVKNSKRNKK